MLTGITFGAWDLLHAGHIIFLSECKENCDLLKVGLHIDPSRERKTKNRPIQTVFERWTQLQACRFVDLIIPYETETDLVNILQTEKFDIRYLGSDYKHANFTGQGLGRVVFLDRKHNYSSSELRDRMQNKLQAEENGKAFERAMENTLRK